MDLDDTSISCQKQYGWSKLQKGMDFHVVMWIRWDIFFPGLDNPNVTSLSFFKANLQFSKTLHSAIQIVQNFSLPSSLEIIALCYANHFSGGKEVIHIWRHEPLFFMSSCFAFEQSQHPYRCNQREKCTEIFITMLLDSLSSKFLTKKCCRG